MAFLLRFMPPDELNSQLNNKPEKLETKVAQSGIRERTAMLRELLMDIKDARPVLDESGKVAAFSYPEHKKQMYRDAFALDQITYRLGERWYNRNSTFLSQTA